MSRQRSKGQKLEVQKNTSKLPLYALGIAVIALVTAALSSWYSNPKPSASDYNKVEPIANVVVRSRSVPAVSFEVLGLRFPKIQPQELDVETLTIDADQLHCATSSGYEGSASWECVRPAPLRAKWQQGEFGFSTTEHAKMSADGLCWGEGGGAPSVHETEASPKRRKQWKPPPLTRSSLGFQVVRIPDALFKVLRAIYLTGNRTTEELHSKYCQSNHIFQDSLTQWQMISLGDPAALTERVFKIGTKGDMLPVRDWIVAVLQQVIESWEGRKRELQVVYYFGLRMYTSDAMMINHRDDAQNRILGVVMQIGQDVDEGWPLYIEDLSRGSAQEPEYHELFLQPGTMVLYEAARITHGRPRRLRGRNYTNAFIHFKPKPKHAHPR